MYQVLARAASGIKKAYKEKRSKKEINKEIFSPFVILSYNRTKRQRDKVTKGDFYMTSFDYIWELLAPKVEFANRKQACYRLWSSFPLEQQRAIYASIKDKMTKGQFVDYNPYFAIEKNARPQFKQLSMNDYYARYGTTEPRDGWKMTNPTGNQVIYVKN